MMSKGLGEKSYFANCHPTVNLIYYVFVIGVTMFSTEPFFLAATLLFSWVYSLLLRGKKAIKTNLLFTVPLLIVMALVNTAFTHNGATVLFYLNGQRITLEALVYGFASAALLVSVIIWFTCFNVTMTSEKLVYIFGRATPVLGLTLSMVFRFIPLLKKRFREISMGQRCMGRHVEGSLMTRVRQIGKEVSILVSWSLEASIETADSMEARGYGLPGRTSFHLYKIKREDWLLMAWTIFCGGVAMIGCAMGKTCTYYFPKISIQPWDLGTAVIMTAYIALLVTPILLDIVEEKRWQSLK